MPTKAKAAKGTRLQRGDGGGTEVFTTVAEVVSFSGPGGSTPSIEASSFDSTAAEYIAGLPDSGEVSCELNFVGSSAQQQGLETDRKNGTLRNFKLILNDHATTPTTISFAAIVTAFDLSGQGVSAAYKRSVTLRISGDTTITYAPT